MNRFGKQNIRTLAFGAFPLQSIYIKRIYLHYLLDLLAEYQNYHRIYRTQNTNVQMCSTLILLMVFRFKELDR